MAKPVSIPPKKLRTLVAKSINTVYQAECDGTVEVACEVLQDYQMLIVLSDPPPTNPPTTEHGYFSTYLSGSGRWIAPCLSISIKKSDYWKVTCESALRWLHWIPNR